jgi:hypothetical protein
MTGIPGCKNNIKSSKKGVLASGLLKQGSLSNPEAIQRRGRKTGI